MQIILFTHINNEIGKSLICRRVYFLFGSPNIPSLIIAEMRSATGRRGRGGRGLAAAARASAASKLAAAPLPPDATPRPTVPAHRTSPRLHPSTSSLTASASNASVPAIDSSAASANLARTSTSTTTEGGMGVGASSATTPTIPMMQTLESPSTLKSDDGSVARKKGGKYDDDEDYESDDNKDVDEDAGNDGVAKNNEKYNDDEITDAINFFGGGEN